HARHFLLDEEHLLNEEIAVGETFDGAQPADFLGRDLDVEIHALVGVGGNQHARALDEQLGARRGAVRAQGGVRVGLVAVGRLLLIVLLLIAAALLVGGSGVSLSGLALGLLCRPGGQFGGGGDVWAGAGLPHEEWFACLGIIGVAIAVVHLCVSLASGHRSMCLLSSSFDRVSTNWMASSATVANSNWAISSSRVSLISSTQHVPSAYT